MVTMSTRLTELPGKVVEELDLEEPNKSESRLVSTVRHIGAHLDPKTGIWSAEFYDSLRNRCYSANLVYGGKEPLSPEQESVREDNLRDSLDLRAKHIIANRHYISEEEGRDVGLLLAAAQWRIKYGNKFYEETTSHYKKDGIVFSFVGPEKSIVVETQGHDGKKKTHVIAARDDLMLEENVCQMIEIGKVQRERPDEFLDLVPELSIGFREALGHYKGNGYHILTFPSGQEEAVA